jgi:ankyrin repeat protein
MARIIPALQRRELRKLERQLSAAIYASNAEEVDRLVRAGMSITASDLHQAILSGSVPRARFLIQKGASISERRGIYGSALHLACQEQRSEFVELILGQDGIDVNLKDDYGNTPLHVACRGRPEAAELLLAHNGIDVNSKAGNGETPLHVACRGHPEAVKLLLAHNGIDVNSKAGNGGTPLHVACRGHPEAVKLLLAHNGIDGNSKAGNGMTPLHVVCKGLPEDVECKELSREVKGLGYPRVKSRPNIKERNTRLPVVRQEGQPVCPTLPTLLLRDNRIDVNVQDLALETPLHYAGTSYGSGPLVKQLLDRGAKLEIKNAAGDTPLRKFLHSAFNEHPFSPPGEKRRSWQSEDFSIFELLLERGANVEARNMAKETMTYVAISQRADAMAEKSRAEAEEANRAYRKVPRYQVTSTVPTESAYDQKFRKYATVVSCLIRHGRPDVGFMPGNADGETCLKLASRTNQVDVVEELLQKYALSANPQRQPLAVHYSVSYGAYDSLVRILEHHRNDPDQVGEGNLRPLHHAIQGNKVTLIWLLTHFGASINRKGSEIYSPLEWACLLVQGRASGIPLEHECHYRRQ